MKGKDDVSDNRSNNNTNNTCINCPQTSDPRITHSHPFYFCKEHPNFLNIHLEVIESDLILAKDRRKVTGLTRSING